MAGEKSGAQTRRQSRPGLLRQIQNLQADEEGDQETGDANDLRGLEDTDFPFQWIDATALEGINYVLAFVLIREIRVYSWFRFAAQTPARAPDKWPSQEIGPACGSAP